MERKSKRPTARSSLADISLAAAAELPGLHAYGGVVGLAVGQGNVIGGAALEFAPGSDDVETPRPPITETFPEQQPGAGIFRGIEVDLLVQGHVLDQATEVRVTGRETEGRELRDQWSAQHAARLTVGTVASPCLDARRVVVRWLGGVDDDGASQGVATVECALWALEDLDPRHIIEHLLDLVGRAELHAINYHGDGRLAVAHLPDAPDSDVRQPRILGVDE